MTSMKYLECMFIGFSVFFSSLGSKKRGAKKS